VIIGLDRIRLRDARAHARDVGKTVNAEGIALADEQRTTAISRKVSSLRLDNSELTQFSLGSGPAHDDVGKEARSAADVEREIAERDRAGADHLDDDRLWQGHDHDVVEAEMCMLRLRPGPRGKCADDVVAEQDHEVIAFGVDDETRRCPDPPDDIEHGVGVSRECPNAWLLAAGERPDERLQQLRRQPLLRGACRPGG
jgi:hypothetical protein